MTFSFNLRVFASTSAVEKLQRYIGKFTISLKKVIIYKTRLCILLSQWLTESDRRIQHHFFFNDSNMADFNVFNNTNTAEFNTLDKEIITVSFQTMVCPDTGILPLQPSSRQLVSWLVNLCQVCSHVHLWGIFALSSKMNARLIWSLISSAAQFYNWGATDKRGYNIKLLTKAKWYGWGKK